MPLYLFECTFCGDTYERNVPVDKRDLYVYDCAMCGEGTYKRKFGVGGIVIR